MSKDITNDEKNLEKLCADWLVEWTGSEFGSAELTMFIQEREQQLLAEIREAVKGMQEYTRVAVVVDPHDLSKGPSGRIPIENRYNQAIKEINELLSKIGENQ